MIVSWGYDDVYYRTAQLLKLLLGLNLGRLTIMGTKYRDISHETLSTLIAASSGWKELHYLSHNSGLLGLAQLARLDPSASQRPNEQPVSWQNVLNERDVRNTGPSVKIYRSSGPTRGSVLNPARRTGFPDRRPANNGTEKDNALMLLSELEKELLVVVKRGAGVPYAESNPATFLPGDDIREDSDAQTWAQIKSLSREMSTLSDDSSDESDDGLGYETADVLVDAYSHVDEYTWPPFHFIID